MKHVVLLAVAACAAPPDESAATFDVIKPLGEMTRFYRHQQLQGDRFRAPAPPQYLEVIPSYVKLGDFPYVPRASAKEIPFVDAFSINRVLGGFPASADTTDLTALDLVHYENGHFVFDYQPFTAALAPYLDAAGYRPRDITMQLGIPWVVVPATLAGKTLPSGDPKTFSLGCPGGVDERAGTTPFAVQNTPWFSLAVKGLRQSLRTITDDEEHFTYKVNGERTVPCDVTTNAMGFAIAEYKAAHDGIVAAGGAMPRLMHAEFATRYEPTAFAEDVANAHDFYTRIQALALPNARLAQSSHYVQSEPERMGTQQAADKIVDLFDDIRGGTTPDVPLEVAQFGLIFDNYFDQQTTPLTDQGPRIAAWHFQTMFRVRERQAVDFYHWDTTFERLLVSATHKRYLLLSSLGWLYSILDHLEHAQTYALTLPSTSPDTEAYAVAFVETGKVTVIASTFSADRAKGVTQPLAVTIPPGLLKLAALAPTRVRITGVSATTAPHAILKRMIKNGTFANIELNPAYRNDRVISRVADMARYKAGHPTATEPAFAWQVVADQLAGTGGDGFRDAVTQLLTLKSYPDHLTTTATGGVTLDMGSFDPDHVKVFVID